LSLACELYPSPKALKPAQEKSVLGDYLAKDEEMLEELRRIRTALETKPAPAPATPKGLWAEFMDFLSKYKVMGLAVAFIIGVYLGDLVKALVTDLIMPIIGFVVPGLDNLATITVTAASQQFLIGHFATALITFIVVALVIFLLVKVIKKWGIE
jgi:large conductance mechanosensitive channel